ncbi:nucleotidyltransferase domain-containing protein [Candidatus Woesearchaeota archaeon]|nr:nucleotidyltransferase domain-containing protein [Candidatus Woesearchaeota archaeon]
MVQINELLGNAKLIKLLTFLVRNSSQEFSSGQIKAQTKLAKATLTKWLGFLQTKNFLYLKRIGLNKLYKVNRENCLVRQFKIMLSLLDLQFLINLSQKHNFNVYLFGSAARGQDVENSDYDILIIGDIKREEIIPEIRKNSKKLKKELKLQLFNSKEWLALSAKDPAFYERVEQDKIKIQ